MYYTKLRLTSCPAYSSTNGQKSRLKALSNGRVLLRLLDGNKEEDGHSKIKEIKIKAVSSKDFFLIVTFH